MTENIKILKSEYLFRRPWLTVRRDSIELPNGNRVPEYYVLEYPDWANVVAVTEDRQIVLTRQYRHGIGRVLWEIPCGVLEPDDPSPMAGAQRELLEETGFGGGEWSELMVVSANPSTTSNLTHCFLATGVRRLADQHLDSGECLEVYLKPESEVRGMMERGEFLQALHLAPLLKYFGLPAPEKGPLHP